MKLVLQQSQKELIKQQIKQQARLILKLQGRANELDKKLAEAKEELKKLKGVEKQLKKVSSQIKIQKEQIKCFLCEVGCAEERCRFCSKVVCRSPGCTSWSNCSSCPLFRVCNKCYQGINPVCVTCGGELFDFTTIN